MGIGDWISGLLGSKNEETAAKAQAEAYKVNPSAYQYGGWAGGAHEAATRYANRANDAQGRQATQADFGGAQPNYQRANQWDAYAGQQANNATFARQGQQGVADMLMNRARGNVPSIAGMQAAEDMRRMQQGATDQAAQAQRAQMAGAASARGAAGVALAQQNAANNIANAQSAIGQGASQAAMGISNQAQINAANERAAAESAAMGAYSQMRGGDQASQGLAQQGQQTNAQQELAAAQLRSGQQQFNAGLRDAQAGRNDAMTLGMTQAEQGVQTSQLNSGMNREAQTSSNIQGTAAVNAGVAGQNAAMNQSNAMGVIGAATGGLSGLAGKKAAGGPVDAGKKYLTGEQGPELIVPATWGSGPPAVEAQQIARADAERAAAPIHRAIQEAEAYVNPYQRDLDRVAATRRAGLDVDDRDRHDERVARGMLLYQAKRAGKAPPPELTGSGDAAEKAAVAEGKAVPKNPAEPERPGLGKQLGDYFTKMAAGVDVGYHGPSGYAAPHLLQARAAGGPVSAGTPYLVGEKGPEVVVPPTDGVVIPAPQTAALLGGKSEGGGAPSAMGFEAGMSALTGPASSYGARGGPTANEKVAESFAMMGDPTGSMAQAQAMQTREDGGPVEKGRPFLGGEKGRELVVPKERYMRMFQRESIPDKSDPPLVPSNEKLDKVDAAAALTSLLAPGSGVGSLVSYGAPRMGWAAGEAALRSQYNLANNGNRRVTNVPERLSARKLEIAPSDTEQDQPRYPTDDSGEPMYAPQRSESLPLPMPPRIETPRKPAPASVAPEGSVRFFAERPRVAVESDPVVPQDLEEPSSGPTTGLAQALLAAAELKRRAELKAVGDPAGDEDEPEKAPRQMTSFSRDTTGDRRRIAAGGARASIGTALGRMMGKK